MPILRNVYNANKPYIERDIYQTECFSPICEEMGPTYVVIPENHINKTFHISCRMPWLRNDDSLYWSPLLIPYRVFRRWISLSLSFLVRSVHSGLWSKQQSVVWLRKSCSGEQTCSAIGDSRTVCVSKHLGGRSSIGSPDHQFHLTYCFLHLVHVIG